LHHTTKYDDQFNLVPFYNKYPEYLPFVGKGFQDHSKILLLGESHYLPKESTCQQNPLIWCNSTSVRLSNNELAWINTRRVVNNIHGESKPKPQKWKPTRTIYRNVEAAMIASGMPKNDNLFSHVAFMNAFQRPAEKTGDSIKVHKIYIEQSIAVINHVIDIIKPNHICFVSTKASKYLSGLLNIKSDSVSHPASPWWNRKSKKGVSREIFIDLLKKYSSN